MRSKHAFGRWMGSLLCLSVGLVFCFTCEAAAQPLTHKVEKGDTLWSISEKYFGDPDVWSKLWEMNPFVTNPHLLRPGDEIKLTGPEMPMPKAAMVPQVLESSKSNEIFEEKMTGIPVGALTTLNARGFLSREEEKPWGVVRSSDSEKLFLTKGDQLFVDFGEREGVKTGEVFLVIRPQDRVTNVITGEKAGYLYSSRAKILVRERTVQNLYRAEIQEGYNDVMIGDELFPVNPVPPCLKPLPADPALRGIVVAAEQRRTSFGRNSVVFLDRGLNMGLQAGSLLELVRSKSVPDSAKATTVMELLDRSRKQYPIFEKVVGRMVVLESRPETATALVLNANESLLVGAFFRGVTWADPSEALRSILTCPVQPY